MRYTKNIKKQKFNAKLSPKWPKYMKVQKNEPLPREWPER